MARAWRGSKPVKGSSPRTARRTMFNAWALSSRLEAVQDRSARAAALATTTTAAKHSLNDLVRGYLQAIASVIMRSDRTAGRWVTKAGADESFCLSLADLDIIRNRSCHWGRVAQTTGRVTVTESLIRTLIGSNKAIHCQTGPASHKQAALEDSLFGRYWSTSFSKSIR